MSANSKKKTATSPKIHGFDILELCAIEAFKRGDCEPLSKWWQRKKGLRVSQWVFFGTPY
jgi:hypothetical protein